ncbi:MAG TPA: DUF4344 domain-containing metallopeptidase [Candidatus Nanoarchaeia archaeon]|nr:DUF4344 domain-containing metallopeptidase [Candidatus Nanoarchaeia archaeon]
MISTLGSIKKIICISILILIVVGIVIYVNDTGKFNVKYIKPKTQSYDSLYKYLRTNRSFEKITDQLNGVMLLPKDVTIIVKECNCAEFGPFYNITDSSIVIPYEFILYLYGRCNNSNIPKDKINKVVNDILLFVLFHEMGHALHEMPGLSYVSSEYEREALADAISVLILINSDLGESAINAMSYFLLSKSEKKELDYWGRHPPAEQRVFNILCLIYGSDNDKYSALTTLPQFGNDLKEQTENCKETYQEVFNSLKEDLWQYKKPDN